MADNAPHTAIIRVEANVHQKGESSQLLPDIVYTKKITFSINSDDKNICIRRLNELIGELTDASDHQTIE